MKTHPEYQYLDLLREALEHGDRKVDRGTDVVLYSLFGRQTRYDLSQGFPLLTAKCFLKNFFRVNISTYNIF